MKVTKTGKINYSNITNPQATFGIPIARNPYNYDEDGNLTSYPDGLINAVDINWGGAEVKSSQINTTDDLLELVNDLGSIHADINDGNVVNVIIGSIRALQAEVARLRNSFRFGINSYTDENFGMTQTVDELNNITEEEPLWATDESELSYIDGIDLASSQAEMLEPIDNYAIIQNEKLGYSGELICNISNEKFNALNEVTDPKLYIYLTSSSKKVKIKIKNETNQEYYIDINNIVDTNYLPDKYNILCILSRKVLDEKTNTYRGNNFAWVSISEYSSGQDIFNGYIDIDNDTINYVTPQTPVYSSNRWIYDSIIFDEPNEGVTEYIYKLDIYSKYQDFKNTIEAATPTNVEDYKYCTAHLTIRSMSTYDKIESHMNELQNNELIYCEGNKKLYIYTNGKIINIGSSSSGSDKDKRMENYEIIKALAEQGLINIIFKNNEAESDEIKYSKENIQSWILNDNVSVKETLNDIEEIKFINGDTGKKFNVTMNPYGEFNIKEITEGDNLKYSDELINTLPGDWQSDRSFVSLINIYSSNNTLKATDDLKLNADRVQIGAIYAPLNTDTIHGCSHGYIELFNSSDKPFNLNGCYLHYSRTDDWAAVKNADDVTYYKLALNGYIPAGGTYLIRCKQYADPQYSSNTYINVDKYDIEWYVKEDYTGETGKLLDLSMAKNGSYQFMLTYGDTLQSGEKISQSTQAVKITNKNTNPLPNDPNLNSTKGKYVSIKGFIDSCCIGSLVWNDQNHWVPEKVGTNKDCKFTISSNTIYKITFELDPAKQAFNSMTTADSSRQRWENAANDYQYLQLDKPYIEFPKSDIKKAISDYTPKASFQYKNVMTDKTQFNKNKPNAIVCSYGANPYTTRCFNWVSHGLYDEAVVIIDPDTNKEYVFESYKNKQYTSGDENQPSTYSLAKDIYGNDFDYETDDETNKWPRKREFNSYINNIVYGSGQILYWDNEDIIGRDYGLEDKYINKRLYNKFPGNNLTYTSHKCIIDLCKDYTYSSTMEAKTYKYYICRLNKFGKKDESYKSDIKEFTLYPKNYTPKVYQVTDQQGFHWIEYQVWAASAKKLYEKIQSDITAANGKLMPIIINTGDMTQSGARFSEWLDYFEGGKYLFDHFEQNNIVGNNDLCDSNVTILGTGDDIGKSNGYFFHIFNCYEIPIDVCPIINNVYVPSLYYIDVNINSTKINRILFINSEITAINCRDWFDLKSNGNIVNIYTGFEINSAREYAAENKFTTIYSILWNWTNNNNYGYLPVCHEMPFTVITNSCLRWDDENSVEYSKLRSLSDAGKLIGSHCNQISDTDCYGLHWLSRLFEYRGIKLCLGGHKHTYACTYPIRENYLYKATENKANELNNQHLIKDNNNKLPGEEGYITTYENGYNPIKKNDIIWSYINGSMDMPETLKDDSAIWAIDVNINNSKQITINLSKFPIVRRSIEHKELDTNSEFDLYTFNETEIKIKHSNVVTVGNGNITRFYPFVDCKTKLVKDKNGVAPTSKYTQEEADEYNSSHNLEEGSENYVTTDNYKNGYIETFDFDDDNTFVTYLMCQATGYKIKSNKELPSEFQKFSMIIPKTTISSIDDKHKTTDKPSADQQMPMFTITECVDLNKFKVQLGRIINISESNSAMTFSQNNYNSNDDAEIQYLTPVKKGIYGLWCHYDSVNNVFKQDDESAQSRITLTYENAANKTFNLNSNKNNIYIDLLSSHNPYIVSI